MNKNNDIDLSVVLPCYNQAKLLKRSVIEIKKYLDLTNLNYEIILAEDGSTDNTPQIAKELSEKDESVLWLHVEDKLGRGQAVENAIRLSRGKYVGYIDVDLSTPPYYIIPAIHYIEKGYDVVNAHRIYKLRLGILLRWFLSKGYSKISRIILGTHLKDTESGFKFFRRSSIYPILNQIQDRHWFWDTEIMVLSYLEKLKIKELPSVFIRKDEQSSTVNILSDTKTYFINLWKFRSGIKKIKR